MIELDRSAAAKNAFPRSPQCIECILMCKLTNQYLDISVFLNIGPEYGISMMALKTAKLSSHVSEVSLGFEGAFTTLCKLLQMCCVIDESFPYGNLTD